MGLTTEIDLFRKIVVHCKFLQSPVSKFPAVISWLEIPPKLNFVRVHMETFMQVRCNEEVGISNCCEHRRIDFPGLTVTVSFTRTKCSSVRQERFPLSYFTFKTELVVSNFIISLRTIDSLGDSFLPKMIWNFHTVCVACSPFS